MIQHIIESKKRKKIKSPGLIIAIADRYENVVERYRYDAYGNPYEGRFLHMPKNNPYGFTGQRFEPELRMYTFAYRTYNPMSMRWMTVDPVRDGTNWYLYVSGDPVNLWDPLGLWGREIHYGSEEYGGTLKWAQEVGFSKEEAEIIAKACHAVDSFTGGKSPLSIVGDQSYHFNVNADPDDNPNDPNRQGGPGDSRNINARKHLEKAIELQKKANEFRKKDKYDGPYSDIVYRYMEGFISDLEKASLKELGTGFHAIQDTYAHKDEFVEKIIVFGLEIYSHLHTKEPDRPGPADKPNVRYYETYKATLKYLMEFKMGVKEEQ